MIPIACWRRGATRIGQRSSEDRMSTAISARAAFRGTLLLAARISARHEGGPMRSVTVVLVSLFCLATQSAHGADTLQSELEAMHARWFKAFDGGDGATMDQ